MIFRLWGILSFCMITTSCHYPHFFTEKDPTINLTAKKKCKCKALTGWASKSDLVVRYDYLSDSSGRDGLIYHKIKFDKSINPATFSGYLRVVGDTIFWLDSHWDVPAADSKIKKEQKLFILNDNAINLELSISTSISLIGACTVRLDSVKKNSEDRQFYFTLTHNTKGVSDYLFITEIVLSEKNWLEKVTIETSLGDKKICRFRF